MDRRRFGVFGAVVGGAFQVAGWASGFITVGQFFGFLPAHVVARVVFVQIPFPFFSGGFGLFFTFLVSVLFLGAGALLVSLESGRRQVVYFGLLISALFGVVVSYLLLLGVH